MTVLPLLQKLTNFTLYTLSLLHLPFILNRFMSWLDCEVLMTGPSGSFLSCHSLLSPLAIPLPLSCIAHFLLPILLKLLRFHSMTRLLCSFINYVVTSLVPMLYYLHMNNSKYFTSRLNTPFELWINT